MEMEKVYESGTNEFFELDDGYMIKNQNGDYAVFDKDIRILNKIKELLNGERSFYYNIPQKKFYFNKWSDKMFRFYCSLRQLIIAITMPGDFEKNLEEVKKYTVLLVNSDEWWNLRRTNLDYTGVDTKINTFYSDDEYFYIRHNESGFTVYTDIDKELNDLLKCYRWNYSENDRRLGTFLNDTEFVSIYRFIKIFYDKRNTQDGNIENWIKTMKRVATKMDWSIDHLDSNRENCCKNNLTWIDRRDNSRKSNLTRKLNRKPFVCVPEICDHQIKMKAGYHAENCNIEFVTSYSEMDDFLNAINDFWQKGILHDAAGNKYYLPYVPKKYFKEQKEKGEDSDAKRSQI